MRGEGGGGSDAAPSLLEDVIVHQPQNLQSVSSCHKRDTTTFTYLVYVQPLIIIVDNKYIFLKIWFVALFCSSFLGIACLDESAALYTQSELFPGFQFDKDLDYRPVIVKSSPRHG